ncbi:MAG: hypothetical protein HS116_23540 [Planctomycetes bacterium]|nr:hypothetical protein [Planctomycetota bacterium]
MHTPRILVTGIGFVAAPTLHDALAGHLADPPETAPEITAFETPEGAPAFGFEAPEFKIETYLPNIKSFVDRTSAFALAAGKLALEDAGLLERDKRPAGLEIGCAYGTQFGCLEAMEIFWKKVKATNPKFAAPLPFTHGYANSPSSLLCIEFGLKGSAATFSGEALAGVEALRFAADQLQTGNAQAVLVCASESLTRALHAHLFATKKLSASGQPALWSGAAEGIVPGEGGAALLLETDSAAAARGRKAYAELADVQLGGTGAFSKLANGKPDLIIAATPSVHDRAERDAWQSAGAQAACIAPKLFAGELFAAAPLLSAVWAASLLQEHPAPLAKTQTLSGAPRAAASISDAAVDALDASGTAGVIRLSAFR